jgi:hypothetical protein
MPTLPVADWTASLNEMEAALDRTLAALDRYQAGWDSLLTGRAKSTPPSADQLELKLREWDARLVAAAELAASVEKELNDREAAVGLWHQSVTRFRDSLAPR